MILTICSCSLSTKNPPFNEINRPVKNSGHLSELGVTFQDTITSEALSFGFDPNFWPHLNFWRHFNENWEYLFIPVQWNRLVTGNQFTENHELIQKKLHASILAGLSEISYSQMNGLGFELCVSPRFKYLFNEVYWIGFQPLLGFFNGSRRNNIPISFEAVAGVQLSQLLSIKLNLFGFSRLYKNDRYNYQKLHSSLNSVWDIHPEHRVQIGLSNTQFSRREEWNKEVKLHAAYIWTISYGE